MRGYTSVNVKEKNRWKGKSTCLLFLLTPPRAALRWTCSPTQGYTDIVGCDSGGNGVASWYCDANHQCFDSDHCRRLDIRDEIANDAIDGVCPPATDTGTGTASTVSAATTASGTNGRFRFRQERTPHPSLRCSTTLVGRATLFVNCSFVL